MNRQSSASVWRALCSAALKPVVWLYTGQMYCQPPGVEAGASSVAAPARRVSAIVSARLRMLTPLRRLREVLVWPRILGVVGPDVPKLLPYTSTAASRANDAAADAPAPFCRLGAGDSIAFAESPMS